MNPRYLEYMFTCVLYLGCPLLAVGQGSTLKDLCQLEKWDERLALQLHQPLQSPDAPPALEIAYELLSHYRIPNVSISKCMEIYRGITNSKTTGDSMLSVF